MHDPKKICIVSSQHLSANPRVWKEADLLASSGYQVVIVTSFNSKEHIQRDKELLKTLHANIEYKAGLNITLGEVPLLQKVWYRFRYECSIAMKKAGIETKYLISTSPDAIYEAASNEHADLYIVHVETGFYVGRKLAQRGFKVVFDFEDWYSEDYLVSSRPVKYLMALEQFALTKGFAAYCPSKSMAVALAERYNCAQPHVVYNGFSIEKENPRKSITGKPVMIWFSQTVGPGRGLERFISALTDVKAPVVLRIVGNCSDAYKKSLEEIFPIDGGHELDILPPVPHNQLHKVLCNADIGLALEHGTPGNKKTTVSNKILQYLQAGLKVIATDTLGQQEIADMVPGVVTVIPNNNIDSWAGKIDHTIKMEIDRDNTIRLHDELFSFDAQHKVILRVVKDALA